MENCTIKNFILLFNIFIIILVISILPYDSITD